MEEQVNLFDMETEHEEEWKGMPEYQNKDLKPWKQVIISFDNKKDFKDFCKLIGQELTQKTISTWYPKIDRIFVENKRYSSEP